MDPNFYSSVKKSNLLKVFQSTQNTTPTSYDAAIKMWSFSEDVQWCKEREGEYGDVLSEQNGNVKFYNLSINILDLRYVSCLSSENLDKILPTHNFLFA